MAYRWKWVNVSPGILALDGQPIQIRKETTPKRHYQGLVTHNEWFSIYQNDKMVDWTVTLDSAKFVAEKRADEEVELGLLEI